MKNNEAQRNSVLMIIIILCTITIIGTNYIFTQNIVTNINETLIENEYKKIGGKENYLILQELQKREITDYLENIKEEKPELIEEILKKYKEQKFEYKVLENQAIEEIKNNTFIKGNSGATLSIIEFSDMECPYCIEQHKEELNKKLFENNSGSINYIFKNFPLPSHQNSKLEAIGAKCIEKEKGGESYINFINTVFSETIGGGEGYDLEKLTTLAEKFEVGNDTFQNCVNNDKEIKKQVEEEFTQGMKLGIESVPTNIILNNKTGEFYKISGKTDYETLQEIVNDIK